MNKFRLFLLAVFPIMAALSGCFSESSGEASYHGVVHESSTNLPFENLVVQVTDGQTIHTQTRTDSEGEFTLTVTINEINSNFYILIGDDVSEKRKVSLPGYAEGVNELGIILINAHSFAVDFGTGFWSFPGESWEMPFECTQSSLVGEKTTRNMRIKNHQSFRVDWRISNTPSFGIYFSQSSGSIPPQGEVSINVTFYYPSPSLSKALMLQLNACSSGSKTYLWNWEAVYGGYYAYDGELIESACSACCWQNPILIVDGHSEGFSVIFNQFISFQ